MPSFDVVSEIDQHEFTNAVDQANREISNRFDFKGTESRIEQSEEALNITAPTKFQVNQVRDILYLKLSKRNIDARCLNEGNIAESVNQAQQDIIIRKGIGKDLAKEIIKLIKGTKLKVQSAIQGDQIRVSGKKLDVLQEIIALLKNEKKISIPLQFTNFRD